MWEVFWWLMFDYPPFILLRSALFAASYTVCHAVIYKYGGLKNLTRQIIAACLLPYLSLLLTIFGYWFIFLAIFHFWYLVPFSLIQVFLSAHILQKTEPSMK